MTQNLTQCLLMTTRNGSEWWPETNTPQVRLVNFSSRSSNDSYCLMILFCAKNRNVQRKFIFWTDSIYGAMKLMEMASVLQAVHSNLGYIVYFFVNGLPQREQSSSRLLRDWHLPRELGLEDLQSASLSVLTLHCLPFLIPVVTSPPLMLIDAGRNLSLLRPVARRWPTRISIFAPIHI